MSDTPRTFQARLIIEAGDWRNEKDCTDYALKVAEELERELVSILESHRTLVHENMELKNELAELNEWKAGMKGVEEFYAMRHQRDEWRKCAEMNNAALQGCLKRYRIAMAEILQETAPIFAPKEPSSIENLKAVSAAFNEFNRLTSKP